MAARLELLGGEESKGVREENILWRERRQVDSSACILAGQRVAKVGPGQVFPVRGTRVLEGIGLSGSSGIRIIRFPPEAEPDFYLKHLYTSKNYEIYQVASP